MYITQQEFDEIVIPHNYVMVECEENDEVVVDKGTPTEFRVKVPSLWGKQRHTQVTGIVHKVCEKVFCHDWETDCELLPGDRVYFAYTDASKAAGAYRGQERFVIVKELGKMFLFIQYEFCYAAIREGAMIPLNGYVLAEPLPADKEQDLFWEPEKEHHSSKAIAKYVGNPVKYKREQYAHSEVPQGSVVTFAAHRDIPLEYKHFQTTEKLFRIQSKDIYCIEE